jgi:hypothetical protein
MLDKLKFEIAGDDFREGFSSYYFSVVAEPQFEDKQKLNLEVEKLLFLL